MILNLNTGKGVSLQVVGGTEQPAAPAENTIWIHTPQKITSWILSAVEPENPEEGMVWIRLLTFGNARINLLKKNALILHLGISTQYQSETWVPIPGNVYFGGAWQEWRI